MQDQNHDSRKEATRQIEARLIELYEQQSRERLQMLIYVARKGGTVKLEVVR